MSRKKLNFFAILCALLAIIIFTGIYILTLNEQIKQLEIVKSDLEAKQEDLKISFSKTQKQLEFAYTDEFMRQMSRERLGYVQDNEIQIIDVG